MLRHHLSTACSHSRSCSYWGGVMNPPFSSSFLHEIRAYIPYFGTFWYGTVSRISALSFFPPFSSCYQVYVATSYLQQTTIIMSGNIGHSPLHDAMTRSLRSSLPSSPMQLVGENGINDGWWRVATNFIYVAHAPKRMQNSDSIPPIPSIHRNLMRHQSVVEAVCLFQRED